MTVASKKRRNLGEHLTPREIFTEFMLPEIKDKLYEYRWVDLFAGEGNLVLPILDLVPQDKRTEFFKRHIFLFDIQKKMVERSIKNAARYGVPEEIAEVNILERDTLKEYPTSILSGDLPVYHITNPPYLYIGYIVKHKETRKYLDYFEGVNAGYQDLYQIGLIKDLRHDLKKMVYIIPSNFLFGSSASNKIRDNLLRHYLIKKAIIFEKEIFEYTGTNVVICFFEAKQSPGDEVMSFEGTKISKNKQSKIYTLRPKHHYRAGDEFEEFVNEHKASKPLKVTYYLTMEEVEKNKGQFGVRVIDANTFTGKGYAKRMVSVNNQLFEKIKSNVLSVRTVDTGTTDGRAGLYSIADAFDVDGILVTKAKYRTHPIQIFVEPEIAVDEHTLLEEYFNLVLEYFRQKTDSEFMTTYKYSNSEYTRKYLGLSQAKKLIRTFPLLGLNNDKKTYFKNLLLKKDSDRVISFVKEVNHEGRLLLWP